MLGQPPRSHLLSQEHWQGSPAQLLPWRAHGSHCLSGCDHTPKLSGHRSINWRSHSFINRVRVHANVPQDVGGYTPTALASSSLLALPLHREPLCRQLPSKAPPF